MLPVASIDSRGFVLCATSCSAGADARMMRNISKFHAVCLLECHTPPTCCWVFLCLWAVVTATGLVPFAMVGFTRELWWCQWPVHRWWRGPPCGLCPCCQWTDENGAASCAYMHLQVTVASAMEDFGERDRHLGLYRRDLVFLVDVVSINSGELLKAACSQERRFGCDVVSLVRSPCEQTV